MCNLDVRGKAAASGVHLWKIAAELGITDGSFSRKLRKELPDEEKTKIFGIIDELAKGVC